MAASLDRVLILGLDGATWNVLDPMRARGVAPNLDALLKGAAHGVLTSVEPPVTTAAWTSMATGCTPARHGVFDHRYYDAASDRMKVNHSGRVRVPNLWRILSDAGRQAACLNVPGLFPPPAIDGVVVSGMDAPHLDAALQGSPGFAARLKAEVPDYTLRYFWKRAPQSLEELQANARLTVESFQGRARGGLLADRMFPSWSALMVQFQNLDPFQHRAWRYLNVDATGIDSPEWNAAAAEVIRGLDRAIGTLCELAAARGAAVMVVSDHGFGPCEGRVDVNRILLDAGVAQGAGIARKLVRRGRQAVDHLRVWKAKRGDPTARSASFDQSVAASFPFDWSRTLAFAPHQDTAAMIYVNSPARRGTTRHAAPLFTPREVDEARDAAAGALAEALHPETGRRLFPRIIATADAYGIDPAREGYPDLIALPDAPFWVRTKLAGTGPGDWVHADPNLTGTHRPEGVVAIAGAGLAPGRNLNAQLIDAAPTVLNLLGLPVPPHMEGSPIGVGRPRPTERLDEPTKQPIGGPHQPAFEYTDEEQAILERRLADLGYLE
ncbi:alkaline phosphatase family protein [Paludisphaera mucosa]|uniref:Alkaline phosphatase family protein n=1 Tax=Paludisphaera mucosa TaxID=3030827 RepID=A0ABT6FB25_9BACT|nr:alkaline phosphatase family protein [Paludisphaera mucosa]MDG3004727.1 alkaline phosphatase family protein [Paludisphaera mucosa]